jgi:hypothetical protein
VDPNRPVTPPGAASTPPDPPASEPTGSVDPIMLRISRRPRAADLRPLAKLLLALARRNAK